MKKITHRVLFEGGPFHGRVVTFNAPPPAHSKINRGEYEMVGRTEADLFLLRWKGSERALEDQFDRDHEYLLNLGDPRLASKEEK